MKTLDAATNVMRVLRGAGHEAFFVGGCVRDLLMGRQPKDFDVTTNARPEQVQGLFEKTIPVGMSFGVVVVVQDGEQIEVATYRADGDYSDARRPDTVSFSESAREDVIRRDFTMNGLLAYSGNFQPLAQREFESLNASLVDHVGGIKDIEAKVIRCIGDPVARFTEDALRMLRAVRFAAQLGFEIEQKTLKAIVLMRENITLVSRERVAAELFKLLTSPYPVKGLAPLFHTGLARFVFTQDFVNSLRLGLTLERFEEAQPYNPLLGLAMLLVDADAGAGDRVLDSLKLSNNQYDQVFGALTIMRLGKLYVHYNMDDAAVKRLAREPGFDISLTLLQSDIAVGKSLYSADLVTRILSKYRSLALSDIYPVPLITGQDLIDMGMIPGPEFSSILRDIETRQLNGHLKTREEALATFDNEGELPKVRE